MKKKEYKEPFIVVEVISCDIICTSGEGNGSENLSRDPFGGETLEQDAHGYIWAD